MSCLLCFSSEPLKEDELNGKYGSQLGKYNHIQNNNYDISMCQAPSSEPCCFLGSLLCFCPAQIYIRKKALNHIEPGSGWSNYTCCQSQFGGCCCIQPGEMGEKSCPVVCMSLEACCFPGMAVSASSAVIRDQYNLGLDEDDIRLIRCNNCLQCFALILNCLSLCIDCEGDADETCVYFVNLAADVTFCCIAGCMTAQINHEIDLREDQQPSAPSASKMLR